MNRQKGIVWLPILIMIVSVAAFSAMAYLVWQKNVRSTETTDLTKPPVEHVVKNVNSAINTNINTNSTANTNSAVNTNTSANTNVSMAGWKTYTNTEHGYTVQYRKEWTVQERTAAYGTTEGDSTAFLLPVVPTNPSDSNVQSQFSVQVFDRQGSETIDQAFTRVRTFSAATIDGIQKVAVKLGGLDATKYIGVPAFASEDDIVALKGGKIFILKVNLLTSEDYTVVTQSFTFDETLGWKTYTSTYSGYTLRYPPTWGASGDAAATINYAGSKAQAAFYGSNDTEFINIVTEVGTVDLRDYRNFTKSTSEVTLGGHTATKVLWTDSTGKIQACWYQFATPPAAHWDAPNAAGDIGNKIHYSCEKTDTVQLILSTFTFTK